MSRKWLWMFLATSALVVLSGCIQHVSPAMRTHLGTERILQRNYKIGQMQAAYVGQPIVRVKDYQVERYSLNHMLASENFVISGGPLIMEGNQNASYPIRGEITINSETYTVLNLPGNRPRLGALIRKDGTVHNKVLNGDGIMVYSFTVSPPDLKFTLLKEEIINKSAGYVNYELIYGGTDGKSLTIKYREYTVNDMVRTPFYVNLVYESSKRRIRFKDTSIEIHEATNEKIVYTVISDGMN